MEEKEPKTPYMTIKEIIDLLAEARTDIKFLKYQIKFILTKIDIVGCELTQNITKRLLKKQRNKPKFIALGEKLEELKIRYEQGFHNSIKY